MGEEGREEREEVEEDKEKEREERKREKERKRERLSLAHFFLPFFSFLALPLAGLCACTLVSVAS